MFFFWDGLQWIGMYHFFLYKIQSYFKLQNTSNIVPGQRNLFCFRIQVYTFLSMLKSNLKDILVTLAFLSSKSWIITAEMVYREFLPYANFITVNFITAVFQNYY